MAAVLGVVLVQLRGQYRAAPTALAQAKKAIERRDGELNGHRAVHARMVKQHEEELERQASAHTTRVERLEMRWREYEAARSVGRTKRFSTLCGFGSPAVLSGSVSVLAGRLISTPGAYVTIG